MVVKCEIEFDNNPAGTYFAGQMVSGKVVITADKPKQVKAVAIKINGFAHTEWQYRRHRHQHAPGRHHRRSVFKGHEDYLASVTYLLGSDENHTLTIESGIHAYTFACNLPDICPTSYEGKMGHIRYTVRVMLIRPWKHDQTYTRGFTVLRMLDLNYDSPLLKVPANSDVEKVFCCWPCQSEPLKMNVTVPQSGYVPGQSIPIRVLVTNDSRFPVKELSIKLVMVVCFFSQTPAGASITDRTTVTKRKGDAVLRHCRKLFNYELLVPATPPTCLNHCRLIQISYQVEIEARMPGMQPDQVVCLPVTIGNVPLVPMAVIEQQPTSSGIDMEIGFVPALTAADLTAKRNPKVKEPLTSAPATSIPWESNAELPPPNYEEALHMQHAKINADEAHDYGQSDFAPKYPVFNVPSPCAPAAEDLASEFINNQLGGNEKGSWI